MTKSIIESFLPLAIGALFLLWFGFNEYFKKQGLTFRQGVRRMFGGHVPERSANVGGVRRPAR